MFNRSLLLPVFAGLSLFALGSHAGTLQEDFSTDPATRGWQAFGQTNLFHWNASAQNLQVTWDSSRTNSYYFHSLGTVLARDDDFALEFDLRLADIATNAKSGPFQIAIGFLNLAEATQPTFWRGSGVDAVHGPRDLMELDYFPAGYYPDFGAVTPTISPTLISSNNQFASGFNLTELTTNDLFHVRLSFIASNQTQHTLITRNGAAFDAIADVTLGSTFTDFRLDTVAISSYSDVGDDFDSVLAHGTIDNLSATLPPPPVSQISGGFRSGVWQVQFTTRTNWLYTLERTQDLQSWTAAGADLAGTGGPLVLTDANAQAARAFYRVRAERP